MNILTIELKKVTAAECMTLTNGIEFSKEIYLGINDSADNWREITDTEADEIKKTMLPEEPED